MTGLVSVVTAVAPILTALASAVGTLFYQRAKTRDLVAGITTRHVEAEAKGTEAQASANRAMAEVAEQIARTSGGLIDQLTRDVERLQSQIGTDRLACEAATRDLRLQIVARDLELRDLRDRHVPLPL